MAWDDPVAGLDWTPLWPDTPPGPAQPGLVSAIAPFLLPGGPHAAVVICPGGGYGGRAEDHEGVQIARWLNRLGVVALVLRYRVSPARHPAPLADCLRALRLVRHHATTWGVDPQRVGVLGFSAGGHLALSAATCWTRPEVPTGDDAVATQSARPDLAIAGYPVVTFGQYRHDGSRTNLLGQTPDPILDHALSLEHAVTSATPPTFAWHTADDYGVPVQNTYLFASALAVQRVPHEVHVFPSAPHGIGLGPDHPHAAQWTDLCARWLATQGFRANA